MAMMAMINLAKKATLPIGRGSVLMLLVVAELLRRDRQRHEAGKAFGGSV